MVDETSLVSPVEARFDASVRPEILRLRSRTPYPRRRATVRRDAVERDSAGSAESRGVAHEPPTRKAVRHGCVRTGS
jgi:hypothetical protein